MAGFNFGQIGDIVGDVMDTDFLDIYRDMGGVAGRVLIYSNIPCHAAFISADNPNPTTVDLMPIITSLRVHMPVWVDIQNADYLHVKRATTNNELMIVYKGVCGFPAVSQSRQSVTMQMNAGASPDEPIPPPPLQESVIRVEYVDDIGENIRANAELRVQQGVPFTVTPPKIINYTLYQATLDRVSVPAGDVTITNPLPEGHEVLFKYAEFQTPLFFRILVNGVFTRNNGSLGVGLHLFRRVPLVEYENGRVVTAVDRLVHPEMGIILFDVGTKLKMFSTDEWFTIATIPTATIGGFGFEITPYVPTPAEADAYETLWYDES